jgi:iron complex transport system substrate-binding protein
MRLVAILCSIFILFSCQNSKDKPKDLVFGKNICQYSKWLRIYEAGNQVKIQIIHPDQSKIFRTFVISKEFVENSTSILIHETDAIAALSATHIGMLSVIDEEKSIRAVSDKELVFNQKVKNQIKSGKTISLGSESQLSIDRIIASKSNTIIYSAFSGEFKDENRLKKIGITCVPDFDWRETHPLGRAEWVLLFGYLTGKQKEAKSIFKEIVKSYNQFKNRGEVESNSKAISGNFIGDYWYAPAGQSFHAKLFKDAGLNYIYRDSKGTGSIPFSQEQIISNSKDVSIWLNPGFSTKKEILNTNPKAKFLPFFVTGKVYCSSAKMNKYWELGAVQPHLILSDIYNIAHPKNGMKLYFYEEVK